MKKLNTTAIVLSAFLVGPSITFAQSQPDQAPLVEFCDPLMSAQDVDALDDGGDEEELTQTRRYDQETSERLTSRERIMNALFEETWNFETNAPIDRYELCSAEPNFVVLWAKLLRHTDEGGFTQDAEGLMSIKKDGSFEFVYAKRPYVGTWELDGIDMVLSADWLNAGQPYRTSVERVETPVEATDADGNTSSFTEEMYRLGGFRFYRLPTTKKGAQQDCSCGSISN